VFGYSSRQPIDGYGQFVDLSGDDASAAHAAKALVRSARAAAEVWLSQLAEDRVHYEWLTAFTGGVWDAVNAAFAYATLDDHATAATGFGEVASRIDPGVACQLELGRACDALAQMTTTRTYSRPRSTREFDLPARSCGCRTDSTPSAHAAARAFHSLSTGLYPGRVLDLSSIDLEEIANALADQTAYEHHWLINPDTGEITFWTADTGIDGQTPVDLDELDLVVIGPLPSWVWYQEMADFADGISDERAGRRLARDALLYCDMTTGPDAAMCVLLTGWWRSAARTVLITR
jgi:hypothetical protein